MITKYSFTFLLCIIYQIAFAQTILEADGVGNTYELINSKLAPGHNAVETPDCTHPGFGRHIDEVFDADLNKYVFRFHIHTHEDDDRCINFDRQRTEIKTYDKSPDSLKAVLQEVVKYQWKFKLDSDFQPSSKFTHIHQIKAVGGSESSMPLITLTPRAGTPEKLQLRYAFDFSQTTIQETDLAPFKGNWVEATETILYDEAGLGQYELLITKVAGGDTLFYYYNDAIRMWKTNADFLRPKWGIYRSLDDSTSLRDEEVLFADFLIEELDSMVLSSTNYVLDKEIFSIYPNPATDKLTFPTRVINKFDYINIYNQSGQLVLTKKIEVNHISIAHLNNGLYFVEFRNDKTRTKPIKVIVK